MSSLSSPCAACKLLRWKCTPQCIFAPYFPPEQPEKFASVHRVFGASNVGKLLKDVAPGLREDAVASLAYEAKARIHDPVHGCVAHIGLLQRRLAEIQRSLAEARKELATFLGPAAAYAPSPFLPHHLLHRHQLLHHPFHAAAVSPFAEISNGPNASAGSGLAQLHRHQANDDDRVMPGGVAWGRQLVAFPAPEQIEFQFGMEQLRVREGVN